ncbi:OmpA family protein [Spirosoma rhododendri]|uniref:OmpA family protein n=1 Tax=Spirosoma rhododendri TaxID=2728024 RepID=A0A7L5DH68_9BACT|nr:OmpA family protein [Spirosoma rhododendri]QJD77646.1 OmpA family protein [Spirosoma rhododendri]
MNRHFLSFLLGCLLLASALSAQAQYVTVAPRVDDINDKDVSIRRVELTSEYTIIYMTHLSPAGPGSTGRRRNPFTIPLPGGGSRNTWTESTIGFQPSSRIYVNQGEKSYKFIRAENIPPETSRVVEPGERVDFVVYFERIEPGYTVFDLYECRDHGSVRCFNFWGVHITNPKKQQTYAQRRPTTPATPRAQTQPRTTPRTTPGVATPAPKPAPEPVQPAEPAVSENVAITGLTRDAKTRKLIGATLTYQLLSGAESDGNTTSDSVRSGDLTGAYSIPVDTRGRYVVTASRPGYLSRTDTLNASSRSVARDFDLLPIEAGTKVTLKNIYFNVSKYDLKAESFPELDRLAGIMQTNPTMHIRLEGHTDTVGDFDANVELSRNRVNEVKRYLVSKGIRADRVDTVGYGPSRPINTNRTLKERPENRRVEMVITKV